MTRRDEAMIEWLSSVRIANMDGVRWALGGLAGSGKPVSLRKAQMWVARLREVGLVDRARPTYQDGSLVWATHAATGKVAPKLFRQTTRHEVAVAAAAGRFLCAGFSWGRDRRPQDRNFDHQTDGVARSGDRAILVEVELTPKTSDRYHLIFQNHVWRLTRESVEAVYYFCDAATGRAVTRAADSLVPQEDRGRIRIFPVVDERGTWTEDRPLQIEPVGQEGSA